MARKCRSCGTKTPWLTDYDLTPGTIEEAFGVEGKVILCLRCLRARLGRPLLFRDFNPENPLNFMVVHRLRLAHSTEGNNPPEARPVALAMHYYWQGYSDRMAEDRAGPLHSRMHEEP